MSGNLSMGSHNINLVSEPSISTDAATKNYVDSHSKGGSVFVNYTSTFVDTKIRSYTTVNSTSWIAPAGVTSIDYLIVGGGGSGSGGGGGAGGLIYGTSYAVSPGVSYTITVGAGGTAPGNMAGYGQNGGSSSFNSIIAVGGGRGSTDPGVGDAGGSGGGGFKANAGGDADYLSPRQGYDGGSGRINTYGWGGGGGGSGSVGSNAAANAGNGGDGTSNSITGSAVTYAGGGGGGVDARGGGGPGSGGSGGGGNGASGGSAGSGTNGLGGGGGGAGYNPGYGTPGNGGSGIVIIKYTEYSLSQSTTISHNLGRTPDFAISTASVSPEIATINSLNSTHLSITISKPDGTIGSNQTIYWMVG
jgi:hypothetical protein